MLPTGVTKIGIWEDGKRIKWIDHINPSNSTLEEIDR